MDSITKSVNSILFRNKKVVVQAFQAWKVPFTFLFYFRWFACLYGISLTTFVWVENWPHVIFPLYFMTTWGELLVAIYFILITTSMYIYRNNPNDIIYGGCRWKTTKIFCQLAFSFEFLIFIFYWSLLASEDFANMSKRTPSGRALGITETILLHAIAPLLITFEVIFNMIEFQLRQGLIVGGLVGVLYILVNFLVTKLTGTPVYPPLAWDSITTLLYLIVAAVLMFTGFFLGYFLQRWKSKKIDGRFRDSQVPQPLDGSANDNENYYGNALYIEKKSYNELHRSGRR